MAAQTWTAFLMGSALTQVLKLVICFMIFMQSLPARLSFPWLLGGDVNGGQECLHQHVANGSLDVCDHFVYHAQHDVEGGDCQHINDKGVVRELEQAGVYKTK